MDQILTQTAIRSALNQNWLEAIRLNQQLLEIEENDVETLNRLAYAYLKVGNLNLAKTTYKKVLKIDKYNPIAIKNLERLGTLTKNDLHHDPTAFPTPTVFLEEPGKTKIVNLIHPASARELCNLMTAQRAQLVVRKRAVEVRNGQNMYVGALPDDLSHRLKTLMEAGNTYEVYIKNVKKTEVSVFIREIKRGKKYAQLPSFSLNHQTERLTTLKDSEEQS